MSLLADTHHAKRKSACARLMFMLNKELKGKEKRKLLLHLGNEEEEKKRKDFNRTHTYPMITKVIVKESESQVVELLSLVFFYK